MCVASCSNKYNEEAILKFFINLLDFLAGYQVELEGVAMVTGEFDCRVLSLLKVVSVFCDAVDAIGVTSEGVAAQHVQQPPAAHTDVSTGYFEGVVGDESPERFITDKSSPVPKKWR